METLAYTTMTQDKIIQITCEVCGIQREDVTLPVKTQDVVMARHLVAHFLYWRLNMRLFEIGEILCVSINSLYRPLFTNPISNRIKTEALLRGRYNAILDRLVLKN